MQAKVVGQAVQAKSATPRLRQTLPVASPTRVQQPAASAPSDKVAARSKAPFASANEQANGNGNGNRALISALVNSKIYRDYEQAFTNLTGLPMSLQPVETWQLPHHGKRNENPFCALMSQKSRACAACLQMIETLSDKAAHEPGTVTCAVGLTDTAVPVR